MTMKRETWLGRFQERREAMRALRDRGMSNVDIARRYRITRERVRQILDGGKNGG